MRRLALLVPALALAAPARAATLHEVVNGLAHATGGAPAASGGGGGGGTSVGDVVGAILDGFLQPDFGAPGAATSFFQPTVGATPPAPDASFDAFLGLESVVGSDGAGTLELHAAWDDLGLGLEASRYFEGPVAGMPSVHLDFVRLVGSYRLHADGPLAVWLDAGGEAVLALEDETILGVSAGLRVERHLAGELGARFQAHGSYLQHGIVGIEAEAALDLWVLRIGYRLLAFDVGPPLHGPELGLAVMF